jgi:hypothetical protein
VASKPKETYTPKVAECGGTKIYYGAEFVENIMAVRQEVPQLSWQQKVHYHVRKIEPPDRIHSDRNRVYNFTHYRNPRNLLKEKDTEEIRY